MPLAAALLREVAVGLTLPEEQEGTTQQLESPRRGIVLAARGLQDDIVNDEVKVRAQSGCSPHP